MNEKGDLILYIIFSIIILVIGFIVYFVYLDADLSNVQDTNFIQDFKTKLPVKDQLDNTIYDNSYIVHAKFLLDNKIELEDKNIIVIGNPSIDVSNRPFIIQDPELINFSGSINKNTLEGIVTHINNDGAQLEINSSINFNLEEISKVIINKTQLNLENSKVTGTINVQGKEYSLDKAYLKLKGFIGTLTIEPDNNSAYLMLDGNIGYLELIDSISVTTLK